MKHFIENTLCLCAFPSLSLSLLLGVRYCLSALHSGIDRPDQQRAPLWRLASIHDYSTGGKRTFYTFMSSQVVDAGAAAVGPLLTAEIVRLVMQFFGGGWRHKGLRARAGLHTPV